MLSEPEANSFIRWGLISKPITGRLRPNSTAKGSPTYPRPIIAIVLFFIIFQRAGRFAEISLRGLAIILMKSRGSI